MKTKTTFHLASILLILTTIIPLFSCKKQPGPGGMANIKGKITGVTYDKKMIYRLDSGVIKNLTVYIVYGNGSTVGANMKTSYDGSFDFQYLQKGHYKIFVYSRSFKTKNADSTVLKEIDITGRKQTIELPDLYIYN